jgi:hypothetical protein
MKLTATRLRQIIKEEVAGMTRSRNLREGFGQEMEYQTTVDNLYNLLVRMRNHHDGPQFVSPALNVDYDITGSDPVSGRAQGAVYLVKEYLDAGETRERQTTDDLLRELDRMRNAGPGRGSLPIFFRRNPYSPDFESVTLKFNGNTILFGGRPVTYRPNYPGYEQQF